MKIEKSKNYEKWYSKIKDKVAIAKIYNIAKRITNDSYFCNTEPVFGGVSEIKIDTGVGYRIYYHIHNNKIYFLTGSDKLRQQEIINKLKRNFKEIKKSIDSGMFR